MKSNEQKVQEIPNECKYIWGKMNAQHTNYTNNNKYKNGQEYKRQNKKITVTKGS